MPEQFCKLPDLEFTDEAFPGLSPEARAFFNTPVEQCDPEMLGVVLEALAEVIARSMAQHEGMRDARDVFLALSSRMEAVMGGAGQVPPAAVPEVAAGMEPADTAGIDPAAIDPPAASPEYSDPALPFPVPAPPLDSATPPSEGIAVAQGAAAEQAATAPAGPQASGVSVSGDTSTINARMLDRRRVPARQARRRLFRGGPGFETRSLVLPRRNIIFRRRYVIRALPQPARLLCYAACAGPPGLLRRA